jgi:hypothetical protein
MGIGCPVARGAQRARIKRIGLDAVKSELAPFLSGERADSPSALSFSARMTGRSPPQLSFHPPLGWAYFPAKACPIALFPAASEREKVSFHQINKKTGARIKYRKVEARAGSID